MSTIAAGTSSALYIPIAQSLTITPGTSGKASINGRNQDGSAITPQEIYSATTVALRAGATITVEAINVDATCTDVADSLSSVSGVVDSTGANLLITPYGAQSFLNSDGLFPSRAIGFARGNIIGFDASGACTVYNAAAAVWTKTVLAGVMSNNHPSMISLCSNGYLYAGFYVTLASDPQQGKLYRSTDNGGTWAVVYTEPSATTKAPNSPNSLVEADNGALFCSFYPASDAKILLKSIDNGTTWVDITANLAAAPYTHIHSLYWCPFRKLLFVCTGDAGVASKVQVSSDYGTTWIVWTATEQTTAIVSDEKYVYMSLDNGANRSVLRYECPVGVNPAVNNCEYIVVWAPPEGDATGGFSWWGLALDGLVLFVYGKEGRARIVGSSSYGDPGSWAVLKELAGSASTFCHAPVLPTAYAKGLWDGVFYGSDSPVSDGFLYAWSVGAKNKQLFIDQVSGKQAYDGWSRPRRELTGLESGFESIVVRSVAVQAPSVLLQTDFEGSAAPWTVETAAGSVTDVGSVSKPKYGRHFLASYGAASGSANSRLKLIGQPVLGAGGSHWLSADVCVFGGSATVPGDLTVLRLENTSGGYLRTALASGTNKLKIYIFDGTAFTGYTSSRTLLADTYYRIKVRLIIGKLPSATGRLTVWVDGVTAIDVQNIVTCAAAGDMDQKYAGLMGAVPGWSVCIDNLAYAQGGDPG